MMGLAAAAGDQPFLPPPPPPPLLLLLLLLPSPLRSRCPADCKGDPMTANKYYQQAVQITHLMVKQVGDTISCMQNAFPHCKNVTIECHIAQARRLLSAAPSSLPRRPPQHRPFHSRDSVDLNTCRYEADAQIARLMQTGMSPNFDAGLGPQIIFQTGACDVAVTEDADLIAYTTPNIYTGFGY
jgi:hypothetical protein